MATAVEALTAAKGEARRMLKARAYPAAASALAAALAGYPGPGPAPAPAVVTAATSTSPDHATAAPEAADGSSAVPAAVPLEADSAGGMALVVRLMLSKALMMGGDRLGALSHTLWLQSAAARCPPALCKQASFPRFPAQGRHPHRTCPLCHCDSVYVCLRRSPNRAEQRLLLRRPD